jgi:hypothetical protein
VSADSQRRQSHASSTVISVCQRPHQSSRRSSGNRRHHIVTLPAAAIQFAIVQQRLQFPLGVGVRRQWTVVEPSRYVVVASTRVQRKFAAAADLVLGRLLTVGGESLFRHRKSASARCSRVGRQWSTSPADENGKLPRRPLPDGKSPTYRVAAESNERRCDRKCESKLQEEMSRVLLVLTSASCYTSTSTQRLASSRETF